MTDFPVFNSNDFDFFIKRNLEYLPILKDKLVGFSEKVFSNLNDEIKSNYPDRHLGSVKNDCTVIWYAIRKDQTKKNVFNHCNFCIEINSELLSFQTIIRDGRYSDDKPIGIFYKKILDNFFEFKNLLNNSNKGCFLQISKRVPRNGKRIMPGNEIWVLLSRLSLEIVEDQTIEYLLMMLKKIKLPGLEFALNIDRGDRLFQNFNELISIGKEAIEDQYKILKFLES